MARPGVIAWEAPPLRPVDINIMHNLQEPGFKLAAPLQMDQPVLSPDGMSYFVADEESHQQNMSIQQQQRMYVDEHQQHTELLQNALLEDHEDDDHGDGGHDMEVETAEKMP